MDTKSLVDSESVIFSGKTVHSIDFYFESYLQDFLRQHEIINSFGEKEVLILSKDVPLHHDLSGKNLKGHYLQSRLPDEPANKNQV